HGQGIRGIFALLDDSSAAARFQEHLWSSGPAWSERAMTKHLNERVRLGITREGHERAAGRSACSFRSLHTPRSFPSPIARNPGTRRRRRAGSDHLPPARSVAATVADTLRAPSASHGLLPVDCAPGRDHTGFGLARRSDTTSWPTAPAAVSAATQRFDVSRRT